MNANDAVTIQTDQMSIRVRMVSGLDEPFHKTSWLGCLGVHGVDDVPASGIPSGT